jgi:hypothetical protein
MTFQSQTIWIYYVARFSSDYFEDRKVFGGARVIFAAIPSAQNYIGDIGSFGFRIA